MLFGGLHPLELEADALDTLWIRGGNSSARTWSATSPSWGHACRLKPCAVSGQCCWCVTAAWCTPCSVWAMAMRCTLVDGVEVVGLAELAAVLREAG